MRKNVLFFMMLGALAVTHLGSAQAVTFFSDPFNYADGDLTIYDGTGDNVSGSRWRPHSGTGFPPPIVVSGGQAVLNQGNPASEDASRTVPFAMTDGVWYYGAMVTVNDQRDANTETFNDNESYFLHFRDGGTSNFRSRTTLRDGVDPDKFTLGIAPTSLGSGIIDWGMDLDFGRQYKVMASYDITTGESKLWINPTDINSTNVSLTVGSAAFTQISNMSMRQDFIFDGEGEAEILIDAIAMGDDFDSVMTNVMNGSSIPEPTSMLLAIAGLAGIASSRSRNR